MNSEHILDALQNVNDQFIADAAPVENPRKFDRQKALTILLAAALTLFLVSCAIAAISEHDLRKWFSAYDLADYKPRMTEEDAQYIGSAENYALVCFSGEGPELVIYQYETDGEQIHVTASGTGEYAISAGLSINHVNAENRHIYFGTITDSHWNPADDTVIPLAWKTLRFTDSDGTVLELDLSEKSGYICILDSPMSDFQVIDQAGTVCLTYSTYQNQGYPISECQLVEE